ncbi:hypothetical protein Athai_19990 [Actinocatenispora thailandica]|uniref:Uncharacterized protein n=1 Tax=Actinocatenispora thailandica TaxID=227318 RepID=A0A7R7DMW5_9ACTN|nr:hypothetical protein [Actinocatenispora thailandica]BCJ34496.1 hypothetical protein Athai_19990 [Actinocatenispora thailandica]
MLPTEAVPGLLVGSRARIRDFSDLIHGSIACRDVAIYRAHRRGATDAQLAAWAELEVAEVRAIVQDVHADREGIELDRDGPHWRVLQC